MRSRIHFYWKLLAHLLCRNTVPAEVIQSDYNRLSSTYDDHFSANVGKHSRKLIEKMGLVQGSHVLDLGVRDRDADYCRRKGSWQERHGCWR